MRSVRAAEALCAAALLLATAGAAPAVAQSFEEALAAYNQGDYVTARRGFLGPAEQGNVLAQLGLGVIYDEGRGVRQDDAEAARWFRRAAEQGQAHAQNNLGLM